MDEYSITRKKNFLRIVFPSDLDLLKEIVELAVEHITEETEITDLFSLKLVLFEAFTNAVKHGSKFDKDLEIIFEIKISEDSILLKIEDKGEGFDWQSALNSRRRAKSWPGGRGIQLLQAYDYNPVFNDKGNILTLEKKL